MGVSQSNEQAKMMSEYGNIFVQTHKALYFAGQVVTGIIYLNLLQPFPGNTITIKLKGQEFTKWDERNHQGNQSQIIHHQGKNKLYEFEFIVYQFNARHIPPGQYSFPFSIGSSPNTPGSIQYKRKDSFGIIEHSVTALCRIYGGQKFQKLKFAQEIQIREVLKHNVMPSKVEDIFMPVTCCCLGKGQIKLTNYFQKNCYHAGQVAQNFTEIDNSQGQIKIDYIRVSLINSVTIKFNNGKKRSFKDVVKYIQIQGVQAGMTALQNKGKVTDILLASAEQTNIHPTVIGKFVNSTYSLEMILVLDACFCCVNHPIVYSPITILGSENMPPPPGYGTVQAPTGWNPQVFEQKNFSLPNNIPQPMYNNDYIENSSQIPIMTNPSVHPYPPQYQQQQQPPPSSY